MKISQQRITVEIVADDGKSLVLSLSCFKARELYSKLAPYCDRRSSSRRSVQLVAEGIESALGEDPTAKLWVRKLRRAAKALA